MSAAIALVGKLPIAGQCKTRLAEQLSIDLAARIQAAFLEDLAGMLAALAHPLPFIAYSPDTPSAHEYFARLLPERVFPQVEGDLGERLFRVVERLAQAGHYPILLVGSDLPTLAPTDLHHALDCLLDHDVVLGPAADGGYWLVGMHQPIEPLFRGIPWSTPGVLGATLSRTEELGLSVALLDEARDVDTWSDLLALAGLLARSSGGPARTRALIAPLLDLEAP